MQIAIIGLGLMGGSLGLALRQNRLIKRVLGYDIDKKNAKIALQRGLCDELINFDLKILAKCDVVVLATPVDVIISLLKKLKNLPFKTSIIELGSTKRRIIESIDDGTKRHFIAAHPMCGTENSGANAAFMGLYKDSVCVLCDSEAADDIHQKRAVEIFSYLGMKIVFMDSVSHDHHTAIISHLPHAISFALANFVMKEEDARTIVHLGSSSFKDMSRIAKSSPAMWGSIFTQNRANLLESIDFFEKELDKCRQMLLSGDETALKALKDWMKQANKLRKIL